MMHIGLLTAEEKGSTKEARRILGRFGIFFRAAKTEATRNKIAHNDPLQSCNRTWAMMLR
jgi:hypothetical protein